MTSWTRVASRQTSWTKVVQEYALIKEMSCRPLNMKQLVPKPSFHHNLTGDSKQKTYWTKLVKEYSLMKEMPLKMK